MKIQVLYSSDRLAVVDKPAGVPSQPDKSHDPDAAWLAKPALGHPAFLSPVHRLDRPTSGALLLALDKAAASDLGAQFRDRQTAKTYLALVECDGNPGDAADVEHHLAPLPSGNMRVYRKPHPSAKPARLRYRTLARSDRRALLLVELETGVKHQIRAQLGFLGLPIVGDYRYGSLGKPAKPEPVQGGRALLLHAARLQFAHPGSGESVTVIAEPPKYWQAYLAALHPATLNLAAILREEAQ